MKRLSRLTALLLAIMVFCAAIAYAEGVSVSDWTLDGYEEMEESASTASINDPWGLVGECGEDNIYCTYVNTLINEKTTAQARYDYMMSLDSEDGVDLEFTMLHYFGVDAHADTNVVCVCEYPSYEPEYVPGGLSMHAANCPWNFANLSAAEQFEIANAADDSSAYVAELSEDAEAQKLLTVSLQAGTTQAMYLEGTELISVSTGAVIADYNAETGAVVDRATGLTVGYVQNGVIVSALTAE